ncbi:MAG: trypsin-like serine peptidase [Opitutaceae bacterium]
MTTETPGPVLSMPLTQVLDTTTSEFRSVCRIYTKTNGGHSVSSGILVGRHHVLTCAHAIYPFDDPTPKWIKVFVAQNGPSDKTPGIQANGWAVTPGFNLKKCLTWDLDLGIIRLTKPVSTGFWSLADFDPARVVGATAHLVGYPSRATDREAHFMFRSRGRIIGTIQIDSCTEPPPGQRRGRLVRTLLRPITEATRLVAHGADSAPSMSGGPIWMYRDGRKILWGIHTGDLDEGVRRKAVLLNTVARARVADWISRLLPPR